MRKKGKKAREALAYARAKADIFKYGMHVPASIDVQVLRIGTKMSQEEFSARFGIPIGASRDWEQERRAPEGPARVQPMGIAREPKAVEHALAAG